MKYEIFKITVEEIGITLCRRVRPRCVSNGSNYYYGNHEVYGIVVYKYVTELL